MLIENHSLRAPRRWCLSFKGTEEEKVSCQARRMTIKRDIWTLRENTRPARTSKAGVFGKLPRVGDTL